MAIRRNSVDAARFNPRLDLPYELRRQDFELAMQDVYDFLYDVNSFLTRKGLQRLDDMLRPAIMSGVLSDMLTASLAKHSRTLTENQYHNGHPDLVVQGVHPGNAVKAGAHGVEVNHPQSGRRSRHSRSPRPVALRLRVSGGHQVRARY